MNRTRPFPVPDMRRPRRSLTVGWNDHRLIVAIFLRLLGLIYLCAFVSLGAQIEGLVGQAGILPLTDYLEAARAALGVSAWWRLPTLFWLDASDASLRLACGAGALAGLLVALGRATFPGLAACYALYLSLTTAGQIFTRFQWDALLLETGFLALFLLSRSPVVILLFRFLIFRFMLMGGVVKLASGDPAWRGLAALDYHFETQPLPSPLAWHAHHLPPGLLATATAAVLVIELAVPFLVWLPRPWRLFAAWSFILLQGSILLTGNFGFFNLLALVLCLFLFEDRDLRRLPALKKLLPPGGTQPPSRPGRACAGLMAAVVLLTCGILAGRGQAPGTMPEPLYRFARAVTDFGLVNGYGPFAVMTTERREILVEGSRDGVNWSAYGFRHKPDATERRPGWNIPHQPRLDWEFWFAALGDRAEFPWLAAFLQCLREGSAPVLGLLRDNPFPDAPPRYTRLVMQRYRFTTPDERALTGQIWRREPVEGE